MKKISLITLLALLMVMVSFHGRTQSNSKEVVVIRSWETYGSALAGRKGEMVIVKPNGEKEIKALEKGLVNKYGETAGENATIMQVEILKWLEEGFEITSFSTDGGELNSRTYIIMTKD